MTVSIFAYTASTFVDEVIPESVDKTFKQTIQIIILYIMILPDIFIIGSSELILKSTKGFYVASVLNILLSIVLLGLTSVVLEPVPGNPVKEENKYEKDNVKKEIDCIG